MSSKMSKVAPRATTGIPVRSSAHSSAVRALQFPTPVSGSEVASPQTSQRQNIDKNDVVHNSTSSSSDDDAVLDSCIKMAWGSQQDDSKQVRIVLSDFFDHFTTKEKLVGE